MPQLLYLWREQRDSALAPPDVQRLIDAGDDVDGLADLAIKDMIARLKADFPGAKEAAGVLHWQSGQQRWQATWGWQFLRLECDQLGDDSRDKFFELARGFGCKVFDPQLNLLI